MATYTCISCRVAFNDGEVQRAHYRTDWHRYNLKRKVADMPPVTADNFEERVLAQRAAAQQQLDAATAGEGCSLCNKKFSSTNAFQNHLQSHKHQQAERQAALAANAKLQRINQKNLEKGLGDSKPDQDARNQALQQAMKEQPPGRKGQPLPGATGTDKPETTDIPEKPDKPPRLLWLEEQANRRKEGGATADQGEEWEDVEEEEEEEMDDDDDDDDDAAEEMMDQDEGDSRVPSGPGPAALPGSLPVTDCLFCSHHSRSLMKNLTHMTKVHSFFIPDVEFLVDLKGLVRYLGEKVGAGNVCLWCNEKGRSFYSTEAVQSHMTDKSHCKLFTDGDAALEFADFYDFRSSYPDRKDGDDAEVEDEDVLDQSLEYDEETLELTLPSGVKLGHRSLMRYYKQRFGCQRTLSCSSAAVGRVLRHYKALGWGGDTAGSSGFRQHRDMQFVQMMKAKWLLKTGMKHNATKQKHFRMQVMF